MDQLEEIKGKTDIVQLIGEAVALKKAGRNFRGLCPFHEEKSPSFMVSPERQMFKCFGCGVGGDVFRFIMERERLEFGEALRLLADRAGVELKQYRPNPQEKQKETLLAINHLASEYYHYLLTEHASGKAALKYLLDRGVTKNSILTFKLGFAPDEWDGLQRFLVNKKKYRESDLELAGLTIKGNRGFYDRFRGRVTFPLFDVRRRVLGFAGRVLDPEAKEAKYVNSPETPLYHKSEMLYGLETAKEAIKKANRTVVVEGELDMITSYQAGVTNVVAIKGSALTQEQIELIKRFSDNVAIALDMDFAGDAAARRGIELCEAKGLNVRVIRLLYGKDPDECIRHSVKDWKDSVKLAVPVYDFLIESAVKRYGVDSPEGKRQISDELTPMLSKIANQVLLAHYVKKTAEVLGVGEEAIIAEIDRWQRRGGFGNKVPTEVAKEVVGTRQEKLEAYMLALLLALNQHMAELLPMIFLPRLSQGAVKQVIEKLQQWFKSRKDWAINQFIQGLPEELVEAVDQAYLTDLKQLNDDAVALKSEAKKVIHELDLAAAKLKMKQLSQSIREAEKAKDKVKAKSLEKEFVEVARNLGYNHG